MFKRWADSQSSLLILIIRKSDQLQNKSRVESCCLLPVFVEYIFGVAERRNPNISTQNQSRFQKEGGQIACLEESEIIQYYWYILQNNPIFYAGKSDLEIGLWAGCPVCRREWLIWYWITITAFLPIQPCHNKNIMTIVLSLGINFAECGVCRRSDCWSWNWNWVYILLVL